MSTRGKLESKRVERMCCTNHPNEGGLHAYLENQRSKHCFFPRFDYQPVTLVKNMQLAEPQSKSNYLLNLIWHRVRNELNTPYEIKSLIIPL